MVGIFETTWLARRLHARTLLALVGSVIALRSRFNNLPPALS